MYLLVVPLVSLSCFAALRLLQLALYLVAIDLLDDELCPFELQVLRDVDGSDRRIGKLGYDGGWLDRYLRMPQQHLVRYPQ
jgi:hypothetical protein